MSNNPEKNGTLFEKLSSNKWRMARGWLCICFCVVAFIAILMLAFAPLCISVDGSISFTAWGAFEAANSDDPVIREFFFIEFGSLLVIMIFLLITVISIFKIFIRFSNENYVIQQTRKAVITASIFIAIYTAFTFIFSPINCMIGGGSLSAVSYKSLIIIGIVDVLYAATIESVNSYRQSKIYETLGPAKKHETERKKYKRAILVQQLIMLIFCFISFAISTLALMSKIITVTFDNTYVNIPTYTISGTELLLGTAELSTQGERVIAYAVFALFFMSAALLILSLISFLSRSIKFNKIATSSIMLCSIACILVGLFGQYYKIVQELNEDMVLKILGDFPMITKDLLAYEITSEAFVYSLVMLGILVILFICHPITKAKNAEDNLIRLGGTHYLATADIQIADATVTTDVNSSAEPPAPLTFAAPAAGDTSAIEAIEEYKAKNFDPCPAFTELDKDINSFEANLEYKRQKLFENPKLPALVNYVVQYARDSKHHLSYTDEKVATFFAGLGATRLSILQGMSGTGKTSLPKIVSEALMSHCDIVEVESSWRDKNELLGYYNEFSKIYTPKKFTQALYKARLNSDTITFIVLDEMNLSRIEYYFSDFLSLMENEPDKREIKLLNLSLERSVDGNKEEYKGLVKGHTLKIPQNVWFIGTANRDESTYDISDKVYDRAHTMNFDRRAQKPLFYEDPIPAKYLPAATLINLFEEAKQSVKISIDEYPVVKKVEELLEPYNISFGNRIAMQIESFVSIYAACFVASDQVIHDAFDIILLSKVVKKLELKSVVDKEELASEFENIGLKRCAEFVANLKED